MTNPHNVVAQAIESEVDSESLREFGGTRGVLGIVAPSHVVLYYLWIAWRDYGGALVVPEGFADIGPFLARMGEHIATGAAFSGVAMARF